MNITSRQVNQISVLAVTGRVDADTAPGLQKELRNLIDGGNAKIVLDLKGVEYLSSAGLHVLYSMHQAAKRANGDLRLCSVPPRVQEVLELSGQTTILTIYPDAAQAVSRF